MRPIWLQNTRHAYERQMKASFHGCDKEHNSHIYGQNTDDRFQCNRETC